MTDLSFRPTEGSGEISPVAADHYELCIMNYELTKSAYLLPLTLDPWQVFTLDLTIDDEDFHAQVEIRYLSAPGQWVISIRDHSDGELLVNMIPLICSCGEVNDLLLPFRHLRNGKGLGSLFCLRGTDEPSTPDPAEDNLTEFQLLWGDSL